MSTTITSVTFSYFGSAAPNDPPDWHNDWSHHARLPKLIKLQLEPTDISKMVWRELIVSGQVQASDSFRKWAELSGQGGYDEASGVTGSEA